MMRKVREMFNWGWKRVGALDSHCRTTITRRIIWSEKVQNEKPPIFFFFDPKFLWKILRISPNFSRTFCAWFLGKWRPRKIEVSKFTKNPRRLSMPDLQANSKKKITEFFWSRQRKNHVRFARVAHLVWDVLRPWWHWFGDSESGIGRFRIVRFESCDFKVMPERW